MDGLLHDLGRVLAFCEELTDLAAETNEDAPRRSWAPEDVHAAAGLGRKVLAFAAGKVCSLCSSSKLRALSLCQIPSHHCIAHH